MAGDAPQVWATLTRCSGSQAGSETRERPLGGVPRERSRSDESRAAMAPDSLARSRGWPLLPFRANPVWSRARWLLRARGCLCSRCAAHRGARSQEFRAKWPTCATPTMQETMRVGAEIRRSSARAHSLTEQTHSARVVRRYLVCGSTYRRLFPASSDLFVRHRCLRSGGDRLLSLLG